MIIDTKHSVIINVICCVLLSAWASALNLGTRQFISSLLNSCFSTWTIVNAVESRAKTWTKGMCLQVREAAILKLIVFDCGCFSTFLSIALNVTYRHFSRGNWGITYFSLNSASVTAFCNSRKSHWATTHKSI